MRSVGHDPNASCTLLGQYGIASLSRISSGGVRQGDVLRLGGVPGGLDHVIYWTPAVLAGGILLVTTGIVTEQEAIEVVCWETLGLLIGIILVGTLETWASSAT